MPGLTCIDGYRLDICIEDEGSPICPKLSSVDSVCPILGRVDWMSVPVCCLA